MRVALAQRLAELWESGNSHPDVFSLLQQHNGSAGDDVLAALLTDQSHRWKTDAPYRVEDYLERLPELAGDPEFRLQLAVGEYQAREAAGTSPSIDEYASRFSDLSDRLRSKLSGTAVIDETEVFAVDTIEIDNLCDEFEEAWAEGGEPSLDDLLTSCPAAARGRLFSELLQAELWWRRKRGEQPQPEAYCSRYPEYRDIVRLAFESNEDSNAPPVVRARVFPPTDTVVGDQTLGDEWIGRYRLLRILGEGAFGRVYLAHDEALRRQVAIKVPTQERFRKQADIELYLQEARTVAGLNHPNIVPVYDAGRTADGSIYVVSRFIEGRTLKDRIADGRPDFGVAAALLVPVAQALDHAHQQRLIHRDVKPANILLEGDDAIPHVADFGLAVREEDYLQEGSLAGTPAYMSPEQARGEGHRLDGRSDIFSLGVVLYELLTGSKPFRGGTANELFHEVISTAPRSPRELDEAIPVELERICLKSLSKRASDRYSTAAELADDLLLWNQATRQGQRHQQIVPKGLRSFDADDAGFFLELLPGPRNRNGLPESLQFWKAKIEETDPEKTFGVGMIYGPSGCGKSSLVQAGLLPHVSDDVRTIYVEATPDDTETRVLRGLRKSLPNLPQDLGLVDTFTLLRRAEGNKVVVVLDQFEQWLHARQSETESQLVAALRQCDGGRLQAVVMVRDDFSVAATRFMRELETRIVEGHNFALVDLFDVDHAVEVLIKFGQAFGKLPDQAARLTNDERAFVHSVASGLAQNGKVVSVRVALFAEMVKSKPWVPATLEEVGGTEGIGVNFLEETFSSREANPEHRLHQQAAREVLRTLLPEVGSDIKGHMRSHVELLEASGYAKRPVDFNTLLRILDGELRLITPTDPEGFHTESSSDPGSKFYQLAHDFLVPSLRDWLTRKQQETRRGRAELKLAERAAFWNAKPENRHLPSLSEWVGISTLTDGRTWNVPQRKMMDKAKRVHGMRSALVVAALVAVLCGGWTIRNAVEQRQQELAERSQEEQNARYAKALVESLSAANTADVEDLVAEINEYQLWATPLLKNILADEDSNSTEKLHASLVLVEQDSTHVDFLLRQLVVATPDEATVIVHFLKPHAGGVKARLWEAVRTGTSSQCIRAAAALAQYDVDSEHWQQEREDIVTALVSVPAFESDEWIDMLRPVGSSLAGPLEQRFRDRADSRFNGRPVVAAALAAYLHDKLDRLFPLVLLADDDREFQPLLAALRKHRSSVISELLTLLSQPPPEGVEPAERDAFLKRQANAAICLLEFGETAAVWHLFRQTPDPSLRSFIIDRYARLGAPFSVLAGRISEEPDPASRYALILALGHFDAQNLPRGQRQSITDQLVNLFRNDADSGVHSAAGWALRNWGRSDLVAKINGELRKVSASADPQPDDDGAPRSANSERPNRGWTVNSQGHTFAVIIGPVTFVAGDKHSVIQRRWSTLSHSFAVSTHEVTIEQFQEYRKEYKRAATLALLTDCPVSIVSWYDAAGFCNWLSKREAIPEDQWCYQPNEQGEYAEGMKIAEDFLSRTGYRLPTNAEWECVCRAETTSTYGYGESEDLLGRYAWYWGNSGSRLRSVGLKLPNRLGLYDVHGGVGEWTNSLFHPPPGTVDVEVKSSNTRYVRGGAYSSAASAVRTGLVSSTRPNEKNYGRGFRIFKTVRPVP